MLVTEMNNGEGLGNQLARYVSTRVIATDLGYDFGVQNPQKFKGLEYFNIDFGKKVIGGTGPEGGPPYKLPIGITYYYREYEIKHPISNADIRIYDKNITQVPDNTKIDGMMQDEQYIAHRKNDIREWLKINKEYDCFDYSNSNTCVINFRGGEYTRHSELFLTKKYWQDAILRMLHINKNMAFIVITDDVVSAKKFFPKYDVLHFNIGKDYSIIKNAYYLILSNSSFPWFPAWLNENLKFCIAPKYWARHNISDGYWSLGYNITSDWHYLDKNGDLFDYDYCIQEFKKYKEKNKTLFIQNDSPNKYTFKPNNIYIYIFKKILFYISKIREVIIRYCKKLFQ